MDNKITMSLTEFSAFLQKYHKTDHSANATKAIVQRLGSKWINSPVDPSIEVIDHSAEDPSLFKPLFLDKMNNYKHKTKKFAAARRACHNYSYRAWLVYKLGFKSYEEYTKSVTWNSIRSMVLDRDKGKCRCCGEEADTVHHRSYSIGNLRGRNVNQLFSVCKECHNIIEISGGHKLQLYQCQQKLDYILGLGTEAWKVERERYRHKRSSRREW
jgi:hypothetical protein